MEIRLSLTEEMSEAERISESERHRALCTAIDSF